VQLYRQHDAWGAARRAGLSATCVNVQAVLASEVEASATLELLMVRYENPHSKDDDGGDCDLGSQCDHMFRFSLDRGDRSATTHFFHYGRLTTH